MRTYWSKTVAGLRQIQRGCVNGDSKPTTRLFKRQITCFDTVSLTTTCPVVLRSIENVVET